MSDTFQKALFLDRDGVINIEKDYLYKIEDFEFIDGIFELCRYYQSQGYLIVVITNQSGIVRNFYTENDFNILTTWMVNEFLKHGITIAKVYHCPHHPDISGDCICRKPNPGMLLEARHELKIDLSRSILIGDKERDIKAGINAGLKQTYLFDTSEKVVTSKASYIVSKLKNIWKKKC